MALEGKTLQGQKVALEGKTLQRSCQVEVRLSYNGMYVLVIGRAISGIIYVGDFPSKVGGLSVFKGEIFSAKACCYIFRSLLSKVKLHISARG